MQSMEAPLLEAAGAPGYRRTAVRGLVVCLLFVVGLAVYTLESNGSTSVEYTLLAENATMDAESFATNYTAARDDFNTVMRSLLRLSTQPPYWYGILASAVKPVVTMAVFPAKEGAGELWTTTAKTSVFIGMSCAGFLHDVGTLYTVLVEPLPLLDPWHKLKLYAVMMGLGLSPNMLTAANLLGRFNAYKDAEKLFGNLWLHYALCMMTVYVGAMGGAVALFVILAVALQGLTSVFWAVAWACTFGSFPDWGTWALDDAGFLIIAAMILVAVALALGIGTAMGNVFVKNDELINPEMKGNQFLWPFVTLVLQLATPVVARYGAGFTLHDAITCTYEDRHVVAYAHSLMGTMSVQASRAAAIAGSAHMSTLEKILSVVRHWLQAVNFII